MQYGQWMHILPQGDAKAKSVNGRLITVRLTHHVTPIGTQWNRGVASEFHLRPLFTRFACRPTAHWETL